MRRTDLAFAVDDALVAVGQDLGHELESVGVAGVRILIFMDHRDVRFGVVRYGGNDVHANVVMRSQLRVRALERIVQTRISRLLTMRG